MDFEVIGDIHNISTIAVSGSIRELVRLRKIYGGGRWRKMKGIARVRLLPENMACTAEIHWYEAHGIGKKELKIKHILD